MLIKKNELDDRLVIEIGKFAILWNCFERFQCHNHCNPAAIKRIAPNLRIDAEKQTALAKVLNKRRSWFGQIIPDYVATGLHPGNANGSSSSDIALMESFMAQNGEDLNSGCLLVIYRIRNNLMHGLKMVEQLNDQFDLFQAVNGVLESIEEQ